MFKLIVIGKNGREESDFATQAEAQAHFDYHRALGHWGKEEQIIEHEAIPAVVIEHPEVLAVTAQAEVLNELGEVVSAAVEEAPAIPAWTEVVSEEVPAWTEVIPVEFTWEIVEFKPAIAPVSPRQIRLALLSIGVTEEMIDGAIAQMPSPDKEAAMIAWKYSGYYERSIPIIESMGVALGLTSEQLDALWLSAATL